MSITRIAPRATATPAPAKISPIKTKSTQRPPCADGPDDWDMDAGSPDSWRAAVRTCLACPLLAQCKETVQALVERGDGPRAMIWAGVAYDNSGTIVENLERHRATPINHNRPMQIIRNGPRPLRSAPALAAPRRHIVLGRPLISTGTDGL
ncbi:hypothetical protein ACLMAL_16930 [Nocardia sp. CWNU-33]|uniref:hypothetical protein n=1 Tax=Nocardia sp. CWNU-33 TaxID=3392117 RepID=UPI00398F1D87